jgi:hypothetical protein
MQITCRRQMARLSIRSLNFTTGPKKSVKKRGAAFATRYLLVPAVTSQGKPRSVALLPTCQFKPASDVGHMIGTSAPNRQRSYPPYFELLQEKSEAIDNRSMMIVKPRAPSQGPQRLLRTALVSKAYRQSVLVTLDAPKKSAHN